MLEFLDLEVTAAQTVPTSSEHLGTLKASWSQPEYGSFLVRSLISMYFF
jgi:hypothetical protein